VCIFWEITITHIIKLISLDEAATLVIACELDGGPLIIRVYETMSNDGGGGDDDGETKSIITLQTYCGVAKTILSRRRPRLFEFLTSHHVPTHTLSNPFDYIHIYMYYTKRFVFKTCQI